MKSKVIQLAALLMASATAYAALEFCYYTANGPCHQSSSTPGTGNIVRIDTTAGQNYNWCSMIGLGTGNTQTQNDGSPFYCMWTVFTFYTDGTWAVAPDASGPIQGCKAAGGSGC